MGLAPLGQSLVTGFAVGCRYTILPPAAATHYQGFGQSAYPVAMLSARMLGRLHMGRSC